MLRMTDLQTPRAQGWIPDLSTFGSRLALLRQAMGWTNVKEAAVACAIAPETWRRWEAGRFEPRGLVSASMKIAGVTGVDYRWLALGPDDRTAEAASPSAGSTLRYATLGERVITYGMADRPIGSMHSRSGIRARPLDPDARSAARPGAVGRL